MLEIVGAAKCFIFLVYKLHRHAHTLQTACCKLHAANFKFCLNYQLNFFQFNKFLDIRLFVAN